MELTKEQFIRDFKDILHERQLIKVADALEKKIGRLNLPKLD